MNWKLQPVGTICYILELYNTRAFNSQPSFSLACERNQGKVKFCTAYNPWKYSTKQQSIVILCNPIFIIYCSFLIQLKSNSSMCSLRGLCNAHWKLCKLLSFQMIQMIHSIQINFRFNIAFNLTIQLIFILWYVCAAWLYDCATVCFSVDFEVLNELSGIISNHWKTCTLKLSATHGVNVVLAYDNSSICFVDPKPAVLEFNTQMKWNKYTARTKINCLPNWNSKIK